MFTVWKPFMDGSNLQTGSYSELLSPTSKPRINVGNKTSVMETYEERKR